MTFALGEVSNPPPVSSTLDPIGPLVGAMESMRSTGLITRGSEPERWPIALAVRVISPAMVPVSSNSIVALPAGMVRVGGIVAPPGPVAASVTSSPPVRAASLELTVTPMDWPTVTSMAGAVSSSVRGATTVRMVLALSVNGCPVATGVNVKLAATVVSPALRAVATPPKSIDATEDSDDDQTVRAVKSAMLPSVIVPIAENVTVSPTDAVGAAGNTDRLNGSGATTVT